MSLFRKFRWAHLWALLLAGVAVYWTVGGIHDMIDINDFDVFYHGGVLAAERNPNIYDIKSSRETRSFVYPPSGAVLLIPLTWFPYNVAGALFTLVQVAALGVLLILTIRWSGGGDLSRSGRGAAVVAVVAILFHPINNGFGNGQINLLVVLLAVGGAVWMTSARRSWPVGAMLWAVAVAVKLTPLLLCAMLVLQRRWGRLAVAMACLVVTVWGIPAVWYGPDAAARLREAYERDAVEDMLMEAKREDDHETCYEMVFFGVAQTRAARSGVTGRIPDPMGPRAAKALWMALSLLGGAVFLAGRAWVRRGRAPGPERFPEAMWDLAALCLFVIWLAPLARKAHLVMLIAPVMWVSVCAVREIEAMGGIRAWARAHPRRLASWVAMELCLFVLFKTSLPVSGWPMPYVPFGWIGIALTWGVMLTWARPGAVLDKVRDSRHGS